MAYTKGPWGFSLTHRLSGATWYVVTDSQGRGPVVEVGGRDRDGQIAEAKHLITDPLTIEANARLIAAAPDLLEACETISGKIDNEFLEYCGPHALFHIPLTAQEIKTLRAAIAKAKSEAPNE